MSGPGEQGSSGAGRRYQRELVRGAVVNVIGLIAKLIQPLFILIVALLFEPGVMGLYFLAQAFSELGSNLTTSGYVDATTIYGSHHADAAENDATAAERLYQVLGNGLTVSIATSTFIMLLTLVLADPVVGWLRPEQPQLALALQLLSIALIPMGIARINIAATKAHMRMEYDAAIMGFLMPIALVGFSLLAWALDGGLVGLMLAHLGAWSLVCAASVWALGRHFALGRVVGATLRPRFHRQMLRFAIPQSLNLTFNKYNTRLDLIMLAAFGFPDAQLAIYGMASLITSQLRQIKLVFSSALAPVFARHHFARDIDAMAAVLSQVTRWTTTLIIPAVFAVAVLRDDILGLIGDAYLAVDSTFMVVLLAPPLLSCAFGLAGNCIIYVGRSSWTLLNSTLVAGVNTLLNLVLIPEMGLIGAAAATAITAAAITILQVVELSALEGIRYRAAEIAKPYAGLAAGVVALSLVWDPVTIEGIGLRVALALGLCVGYLAVLWVVRHPEALALIRRRRPRADAPR